FFFQAEDGIRDKLVTGVQTCALPICRWEFLRRGAGGTPIDVITRILGKSKSFDPDGNLVCTWALARGFNAADGAWHLGITGFGRSEERRVGKECRCRWARACCGGGVV